MIHLQSNDLAKIQADVLIAGYQPDIITYHDRELNRIMSTLINHAGGTNYYHFKKKLLNDNKITECSLTDSGDIKNAKKLLFTCMPQISEDKQPNNQNGRIQEYFREVKLKMPEMEKCYENMFKVIEEYNEKLEAEIADLAEEIESSISTTSTSKIPKLEKQSSSKTGIAGIPPPPPLPDLSIKTKIQKIKSKKLSSIAIPILGTQFRHCFPHKESVELLVRVSFEYLYGPKSKQSSQHQIKDIILVSNEERSEVEFLRMLEKYSKIYENGGPEKGSLTDEKVPLPPVPPPVALATEA